MHAELYLENVEGGVIWETGLVRENNIEMNLKEIGW